MAEPWYVSELACPDCGSDLVPDRQRVTCSCGFSASLPDLRPQRLRAGSAAIDFTAIDLARPAPAYSGPRAQRDSSELFSAVQLRLAPGARLLDVGCGPKDQSIPAAHLGLRYAGIDIRSSSADLLSDGHAIPFRAGTFDAVLAYAVLEHFYNPALALREIARVLKPGGVFFGTVSQGEPFHDSYFHHTAWGVVRSFRDAGLTVVRLWPSFDTLHGLVRIGRYPRAVKWMVEAVYRLDRALPILAPRQFFKRSQREKQIEELYRAASICFVAVKDA